MKCKPLLIIPKETLPKQLKEELLSKYPLLINYEKEHTKPIMKKFSILSVFNSYTYHIFLEVYKCLRFHSPYPIMQMFYLTDHEKLRLRPTFYPKNTKNNNIFVIKASHIWNHLVGIILFKEVINAKFFQKLGRSKAMSVITMKTKILDISMSIASTKAKLKKLLINNQSLDGNEWIASNHTLPRSWNSH